VAFALVIVELVTGTFYLLVLGIAGFAGAAVAWSGLVFHWQALVAAIVAIAGMAYVHHWRLSSKRIPSTFSVDAGHPASFDSWINRDTGQARVKYRDALWDAHIEGDAQLKHGDSLYVVAANGNTLKVSKTRPG
jgi:membrane protein implicated in regulation of membrane protease activity